MGYFFFILGEGILGEGIFRIIFFLEEGILGLFFFWERGCFVWDFWDYFFSGRGDVLVGSLNF